MIEKNITVFLLYILLSFLTTIYIFGFDYISFTNSSWLSTRDMTADLISWQYFKNDIWRFPIGNNPNYGIDIATGIAFSGSIPFLCILFKIFGNFLPSNFHFFSLWIFICFFLQSLKNVSNNANLHPYIINLYYFYQCKSRTFLRRDP